VSDLVAREGGWRELESHRTYLLVVGTWYEPAIESDRDVRSVTRPRNARATEATRTVRWAKIDNWSDGWRLGLSQNPKFNLSHWEREQENGPGVYEIAYRYMFLLGNRGWHGFAYRWGGIR
jgi:hypothetical protein